MKHATARRLSRPALVAALAGGMLLTGGVPAAEAAPADGKRKLGAFGHRGVKLGMSVEQARATGKLVRTGNWANCSEWEFRTGPRHRGGPDVLISRRHGVAVIIVGEGVKTSRGIGIGSTRRQLRRAYPDLETAGSGFPIAAVPRNPNAHYYFLLSGRKVSQMALVLKGQDCMN
ncbi:hypothetical protein [Planobispora longispora]|uniref:Uncharacterized protein n=1 Tax=Planobispora longispora TaxID=28887 RepID=A0A8J3W6P3_9ACTN|nr:hypothetical protein [Planobispora longispora]GIH77026.1 hypothetical protein Plo01_34550 [Planobispora longispora]